MTRGAAIALLLSAGFAYAQIRPFPLEPVLRAPYAGEWLVEKSRNDGASAISTNTSVLQYRDTAGRTRTEQTTLASRPAPESPAPARTSTLIQISDPVAGVLYSFDARDKIALRRSMPKAYPQAQRQSPPAPRLSPWISGTDGCCGAVNEPIGPASYPSADGSSSPNRDGPFLPSEDRTHVKKLGTKMIEGIRAVGIRRTETMDVRLNGEQKVRRVQITREVWESPDLKITLVFQSSNPVVDTTEKLLRISRVAPDPALFQPPPDYQIVDR